MRKLWWLIILIYCLFFIETAVMCVVWYVPEIRSHFYIITTKEVVQPIEILYGFVIGLFFSQVISLGIIWGWILCEEWYGCLEEKK